MRINPRGIKRGKRIKTPRHLMEIIRGGASIYFERVPLGIEYAVYDKVDEYGQYAFEDVMSSLEKGKLFEVRGR